MVRWAPSYTCIVIIFNLLLLLIIIISETNNYIKNVNKNLPGI